jgi:hypothetical protein
MIPVRRVSVVVAVVTVVGTLALTARQSSRASPQPACEQAKGVPSGEQLQRLVRQYYPGLATRDPAPAKLAIGFVLDGQCGIRRHGVAFLPDSDYSEDVIMTVFPDIVRRDETAGIGNAVPPRTETDLRRPNLVATFIVMRR